MSIYVYQLGEFVFQPESTNVAGLRIDMKRSFRTEVSQPAGGTSVSFSNFMQLPEPQDVSITGTLVCQDCMSVADQMNRLMSIGGVPYIDVIGYIPNPCCSGASCNLCANCRTGHPVTWVTTTGIITSIDRQVSLDSRNPHSSEAVEIRVQLTLDAYWYPINRFLWDVIWGTDEVDLFEQTTLLEHHAATLPKAPTGKFVFRRVNYKNWYVATDPNLWNSTYYDPAHFTAKSFESGTYEHIVRPDRKRWSAPPTSLYAFRNCPSSGIITIDVTSEISPGRLVEQRSTINLAQISSLLTSYSLPPIQYNDIVFATDNAFAPGYVLRNNQPIMIQNNTRLLKAEWSYPYQYPGQLLGRQNKVSFTGVDTYNIETAWLHQHRML